MKKYLTYMENTLPSAKNMVAAPQMVVWAVLCLPGDPCLPSWCYTGRHLCTVLKRGGSRTPSGLRGSRWERRVLCLRLTGPGKAGAPFPALSRHRRRSWSRRGQGWMDFEGVRGAWWAFPGMFSGVLGFKVTWSKWYQESSTSPSAPETPLGCVAGDKARGCLRQVDLHLNPSFTSCGVVG